MHDRVNMNEPLVFSDDIKIFSRNAKRSIFVRDLPYCCTSADLGDFFAQALNTVVLHAMVCRNKQGRTLQIGYVLFQSEEAVRIALETMNGCRFIGRDIRVLVYDPKAHSVPSTTGLVHVSFKTASPQQPLVTEATIRRSFEMFGEIEHVAIRTHKYTDTGLQGGYGFVTYRRPEINRYVIEKVRQLDTGGVQYDCSWSSLHTHKGSSGEEIVIDPRYGYLATKLPSSSTTTTTSNNTNNSTSASSMTTVNRSLLGVAGTSGASEGDDFNVFAAGMRRSEGESTGFYRPNGNSMYENSNNTATTTSNNTSRSSYGYGRSAPAATVTATTSTSASASANNMHGNSGNTSSGYPPHSSSSTLPPPPPPPPRAYYDEPTYEDIQLIQQRASLFSNGNGNTRGHVSGRAPFAGPQSSNSSGLGPGPLYDRGYYEESYRGPSSSSSSSRASFGSFAPRPAMYHRDSTDFSLINAHNNNLQNSVHMEERFGFSANPTTTTAMNHPNRLTHNHSANYSHSGYTNNNHHHQHTMMYTNNASFAQQQQQQHQVGRRTIDTYAGSTTVTDTPSEFSSFDLGRFSALNHGSFMSTNMITSSTINNNSQAIHSSLNHGSSKLSSATLSAAAFDFYPSTTDVDDHTNTNNNVNINNNNMHDSAKNNNNMLLPSILSGLDYTTTTTANSTTTNSANTSHNNSSMMMMRPSWGTDRDESFATSFSSMILGNTNTTTAADNAMNSSSNSNNASTNHKNNDNNDNNHGGSSSHMESLISGPPPGLFFGTSSTTTTAPPPAPAAAALSELLSSSSHHATAVNNDDNHGMFHSHKNNNNHHHHHNGASSSSNIDNIIDTLIDHMGEEEDRHRHTEELLEDAEDEDVPPYREAECM